MNEDKAGLNSLRRIIKYAAIATAAVICSGLFTVYADFDSYLYFQPLYLALSVICLIINLSLGIYIFLRYREYAARYSVVWIVNTVISAVCIIMYFARQEKFLDTVIKLFPYHIGFNVYEALRAAGIIKSSQWYGRRRWYRWFR